MLNNAYSKIMDSSYSNADAIEQLYRTWKRNSDNCTSQNILHFIVSFEAGYPHDKILYLSNEIADLFIPNHQLCFALHDDTGNPHVHFAISTTSYITGCVPMTTDSLIHMLPKLHSLGINNGINLIRV